MAKRIVMMAVGLLLLVAPLGLAHGFTVVAKASFQQPDQLTVKLVDAALKPVGGAAVTAAVSPGGKPVTLAEGPEGTYIGKVSGFKPGEVEFALEALVDGQRHAAKVSMATDREQPEVTRAMSEPKAGGPVEEPQAPPAEESGAVTWRLFVGAAAIAGAAAMGARARRRRA